jgi:hypothetical protein
VHRVGVLEMTLLDFLETWFVSLEQFLADRGGTFDPQEGRCDACRAPAVRRLEGCGGGDRAPSDGALAGRRGTSRRSERLPRAHDSEGLAAGADRARPISITARVPVQGAATVQGAARHLLDPDHHARTRASHRGWKEAAHTGWLQVPRVKEIPVEGPRLARAANGGVDPGAFRSRAVWR